MAANVEDIIKDVCKEADLPPGAIPLHIVVCIEYAEPGAESSPGRPRMAYVSDDDMPPWTCMGLLQFAYELEYRSIRREDEM